MPFQNPFSTPKFWSPGTNATAEPARFVGVPSTCFCQLTLPGRRQVRIVPLETLSTTTTMIQHERRSIGWPTTGMRKYHLSLLHWLTGSCVCLWWEALDSGIYDAKYFCRRYEPTHWHTRNSKGGTLAHSGVFQCGKEQDMLALLKVCAKPCMKDNKQHCPGMLTKKRRNFLTRLSSLPPPPPPPADATAPRRIFFVFVYLCSSHERRCTWQDMLLCTDCCCGHV